MIFASKPKCSGYHCFLKKCMLYYIAEQNDYTSGINGHLTDMSAFKSEVATEITARMHQIILPSALYIECPLCVMAKQISYKKMSINI
jgi:hypothetical protein